MSEDPSRWLPSARIYNALPTSMPGERGPRDDFVAMWPDGLPSEFYECADALAKEESTDGRIISTFSLSGVKPRRVKWLWAGRIPMGEVTLIVGKGGAGKSTLLANMSGQITTGIMQGEFFGTPRDILYVANEDSYEYTIVPRLIAAGADMARIHPVMAKTAGRTSSVILPLDCDQLARVAAQRDAAVIMLDPLSSNLEVRRNSQDEMRPAMERIRRMAEASRLAVIGLGHTRKAMSTNLMDAILGSSELGNVVRSAIGVMADPEDKGVYVLSQEKNNLGRLDVPSLTYRIAGHIFMSDGELIETSRIDWQGESDKTVSDMLAEAVQTGNGGALKEAVTFLRNYLTDHGGEAPLKEVRKAADEEMISSSSLKRAATKLNLISLRSGFPAVAVWQLPAIQSAQSDQQGHELT